MSCVISDAVVCEYEQMLRDEDKSSGTRQMYLRILRTFRRWLGERELTHDAVLAFRASLLDAGRKASTVNTYVAALNHFLAFLGRDDCRMKALHLQRRAFRDSSRDLSKDEYWRMVHTAQNRGFKMEALLLETLGGTGIRVSETKYITVEAAKAGKAEILLKGKVRTILIPGKLQRSLLYYARENHIAEGEIFLSHTGNPLDRKQIWAILKKMGSLAGVEQTKVFPHNLRHFFAVTFYSAYQDIVALADILGHSKTDTTRIYLMTTEEAHIRRLNNLGLVT